MIVFTHQDQDLSGLVPELQHSCLESQITGVESLSGKMVPRSGCGWNEAQTHAIGLGTE